MGPSQRVDEFASMRRLTILALKEVSAILRIGLCMAIDEVNTYPVTSDAASVYVIDKKMFKRQKMRHGGNIAGGVDNNGKAVPEYCAVFAVLNGSAGTND